MKYYKVKINEQESESILSDVLIATLEKRGERITVLSEVDENGHTKDEALVYLEKETARKANLSKRVQDFKNSL